jgi:hypothetical protein
MLTTKPSCPRVGLYRIQEAEISNASDQRCDGIGLGGCSGQHRGRYHQRDPVRRDFGVGRRRSPMKRFVVSTRPSLPKGCNSRHRSSRSRTCPLPRRQRSRPQIPRPVQPTGATTPQTPRPTLLTAPTQPRVDGVSSSGVVDHKSVSVPNSAIEATPKPESTDPGPVVVVDGWH